MGKQLLWCLSLKRCFASLLLIFFVSKIASAQKNFYEPLKFDSTDYLVYDPDLRFSLGIQGSIELHFKIARKLSGPGYYYIVRNANDNDDGQFSIAVNATLDSVRFSNSKKSITWPAKLLDHGYHHLVFVTDRGKTAFYLDGQMSNQPTQALIGYEPANFLNNELQIGNNGDSSFNMRLRTLRIWRRPLDPKRIKQLRNHYGAPEGNDSSLFQGLVGYSYFTTEANDFYFTSPDLYISDFAGVEDGDYHFIPSESLPDSFSYDISSVFFKSDSTGISDFIPVIARKKNGYLYATQPAFLQLTEPASNYPGIDTTSFPFVADTFHHFAALKATPGFANMNETNLYKNLPVKRFFGTYNGSKIMSLSMVSKDLQTMPLVTLPANTGTMALEPFCIDIPDHSVFRGFITRQNAEGLKSLAMVYSMQAMENDHAVLSRLSTGGRWIGINDKSPQRGEDLNPTGTRMAGNYTSMPVYTIKEVIDDSLFILFRDDGIDSLIQSATFKNKQLSLFEKIPDSSQYSPLVSKYTRLMGYRSIGGNGQVVFSNERIITNGLPGSEMKGLFSDGLARPAAYSDPYPDKIAWGGTFAQDQRPAVCKASFVGYNIYEMDPRDFQKSTYSQKEIFKYPDEDSYDYYTTDNKTIVPYGLLYRNDNIGTEISQAQTNSSGNDHTVTWAEHLGAKIGIPEIVSFSANKKYENRMKLVEEYSYSTTTAKSIEGKYALVLDKSTMELSDDFVHGVNKLRNEFLNNINPDYDGFMRDFGTHYPYAITYGGMAYLEITGATSETDKQYLTKEEVETTAEAAMEDITFGASGGYSQEIEDKIKATNKSEGIKFGTFGGSMSKGQGWSLSKGEEVPIFMDLRPIPQLLSPIYFDDPIIWTDIRTGLWNRFNRIADSTDSVMKMRKMCEHVPITINYNGPIQGDCTDYFQLSYIFQGTYYGDVKAVESQVNYVIPADADSVSLWHFCRPGGGGGYQYFPVTVISNVAPCQKIIVTDDTVNHVVNVETDPAETKQNKTRRQ